MQTDLHTLVNFPEETDSFAKILSFSGNKLVFFAFLGRLWKQYTNFTSVCKLQGEKQGE